MRMERYQDNVGAGSVADSISTKKGRLEGGPFQTELVTILQFSRLATTVATAAAGTTASLARLAGLAQHKSRCGYDNDCHDNQFHVHTGTSLPHTRRMCAFSLPWRIHSGHRRHCRNGGRRIPRSDRYITAKDMSFLSFELGSFETNVKILNIIFNNYPKYFDPGIFTPYHLIYYQVRKKGGSRTDRSLLRLVWNQFIPQSLRQEADAQFPAPRVFRLPWPE